MYVTTAAASPNSGPQLLVPLVDALPPFPSCSIPHSTVVLARRGAVLLLTAQRGPRAGGSSGGRLRRRSLAPLLGGPVLRHWVLLRILLLLPTVRGCRGAGVR
jgi:hypothetical protein